MNRDSIDFKELSDKEKELYSEIEHMIIRWSIDGTKTAGSLTRQIMGLGLYLKELDKLKQKIISDSEEVVTPGTEDYDYPEYGRYVSVHSIKVLFNDFILEHYGDIQKEKEG